MEGCNLANSGTKVIKAYLDEEGDPVFTAEMFVATPEDFKPVFKRLLVGMEIAIGEYRKKSN